MSLFGKEEKKQIQILQNELVRVNKRNRELEALCNEKDTYFMEMMSDGLRHGSSLAGKHMADRKKYKQGN